MMTSLSTTWIGRWKLIAVALIKLPTPALRRISTSSFPDIPLLLLSPATLRFGFPATLQLLQTIFLARKTLFLAPNVFFFLLIVSFSRFSSIPCLNLPLLSRILVFRP